MASSTRNSCFELLFPISIQVMCLSSMEKQCPMPLLDVHVLFSFLFIPSFHMHTPVYLPIWALEWNPTHILTMTASLHNFDPCWQANTCWTYSHILIFLLHDKSPFFFSYYDFSPSLWHLIVSLFLQKFIKMKLNQSELNHLPHSMPN